MMIYKSRLLSGTIALFAVACPSLAVAQENDLLEEIMVTARKRAESLQDIPITLTAVTSELIKDANLNSAADVAAFTPGFVFETNGSARDALPSIRGITNTSVFVGFRESSAFLDGWFISGTTTPPPFIDIERIEILKGPQSAAFGRATYSGAVAYVTVDPTDEFDLDLRMEAGTRDTYQLSARVGGALIEDKLYAQVAGHYRTADGDKDWVNPDGVQFGNQQQEYVSAKLIYKPYEGAEIEARYSHFVFDESPPATRALPGASRISDPRFGGSDFYIGRLPFEDGSFDIDFSQIAGPGNRIAKHNAYLEGNFDIFSGHSLFVGFSYNEETTVAWEGDIDGRRSRVPVGSELMNAGGGFASRFNQFREDYQFEVRIDSPADQKLRYLGGFYYINSDNIFYLDQPVTQTINFSFSDEFVESYSPFAAIEYDVTDRFTFGLEGRYNIDKLRFVGFANCFRFSPADARGGCPFGSAGSRVENGLAESDTFKKFVFRTTADYRISDNLLVYGLVARGNQPGRFNLNDQIPEEERDSFTVVDEQTIWNYEVGIKGTALDDRLRFALAGFYMDISDQQATNTVEVVQEDGTIFPVTGVVNAGDVRSLGVELEAGFQITDEFTINGTVAYINSEYTFACSDRLEDITGVDEGTQVIDGAPNPNANPAFADAGLRACGDVEGNQLPFQPTWSGSLSAVYETQSFIEGFDWFLRGDAFFESKKFIDETNFAFLPGFAIVNARTGFRSDQWTVEFYASNITDEDTPTRSRSFSDSSLPGGNRINASIVERQGRRFGVRALLDF